LPISWAHRCAKSETPPSTSADRSAKNGPPRAERFYRRGAHWNCSIHIPATGIVNSCSRSCGERGGNSETGAGGSNPWHRPSGAASVAECSYRPVLSRAKELGSKSGSRIAAAKRHRESAPTGEDQSPGRDLHRNPVEEAAMPIPIYTVEAVCTVASAPPAVGSERGPVATTASRLASSRHNPGTNGTAQDARAAC
jgi:hypothetical protein